jgi:hypothetical protein
MGRLGWALLVVLIVGGVGIHYATNSNARFCLTHTCIGDFGSAHGSIVECSDGTWSHSGGIQGACSYHGGVGGGSYSSGGSGYGSSSDYASEGSGDDSVGSGYGSSGSGYASSGSSPPTSAPTTTLSPVARALVAAKRRAAARAARARRTAASRTALFAITSSLIDLNNRIADAHGKGSGADLSELERIEQRLTNWQVAHSLDAPIGSETPLRKLADDAFSLASTLQLVIQGGGTGIWTPEWNQAIHAYKAAAAAVH